MSTDLTFITNQPDSSLLERFKVLIKSNTKFFDCLVGYFYTSGFYRLYKSLEQIERIRILIGINTGKQTYDLLEESRTQTEFDFSHSETKEEFTNEILQEMEKSEDKSSVEESVRKFIEWLINGRSGDINKKPKLQIRAYPSRNIHAKLYIMTFAEGDRDKGRVITGSSNFTQSGLFDNLEFNVELKDRSDYEFAISAFNDLWEKSVDVSQEYIETIKTGTWLNNNITPYELYLKFLYEYLKEKINIDQEEVTTIYVPQGFMDLEYQREAVSDAKSKLQEYGGVFLADVVGLGKTYISAMLAQQLDGRNLIICPPILKDYWENTFQDFRIPATVESLGKLDEIIEIVSHREYKNVFIDEAHRFRNESTQTYEKLKQVCWGKRVILVSATPQNNTPFDLLSQIKLFQKGRNSTLPNLKNLEKYFSLLQKRLDGIDRLKNFDTYISIIKENSKKIREDVLKYLIVRRTRKDIKEYFIKDLTKKGLKFPEIEPPRKLYYQFDKHTDFIFNETISKIRLFKYARYTPLLYLKHPDPEEEVGQRNLRRFMKVLLVKRLESSFFAFKNTLNRFLYSYEQFINMFDKGTIYISKKYTNKIFDLLEKDNVDEIMKLVEEEKVRDYKKNDFLPEFLKDLKDDIKILKEIIALWGDITVDPKIGEFKRKLSTEKILKDNKIIVFTESMETAEYLEHNLKSIYNDAVLSFSSKSGSPVREKIIQNFDPKCKTPKNNIKILISTDILSEGVNLHRSNVVINYDIPWNPIRIIQRVGRINRVDTKFDKIFIYNFFPTVQSNEEIMLEQAAVGKLQAFHDILGEDAAYLTDGEEVSSFELFKRLNSKEVIEGEEQEESELKYLSEIRNIRDKTPDLFEKVKRLPKKSRSSKLYSFNLHSETSAQAGKKSVLTFFRKGKLRKMFISNEDATRELDFFQTAEILKADKNTKREKIDQKYYKYLEKNKNSFKSSLIEDVQETITKGGKSSEVRLTGIIKAILKMKGFTEDDEDYLRKVLNLLEEGALPKQTSKTIIKKLGKENNHLKIYGIIRKNVPDTFLTMPVTELPGQTSGPREVILSEYLINKQE
ncbi:MAG: helicase [Ignavibacteria bacterium]|nr:helicase [Ignavibacteria bacterium]